MALLFDLFKAFIYIETIKNKFLFLENTMGGCFWSHPVNLR